MALLRLREPHALLGPTLSVPRSFVCGVWRVVCGMWRVACGVWRGEALRLWAQTGSAVLCSHPSRISEWREI